MSDKTSDKRYRITLTEKQLSLIGQAVDMMLGMASITRECKSDEDLEYETIYSAIKKYETDRKLNVGKCYPVQCGEEPVPKIEMVDDGQREG